jgi:hypothetical protein
MHTKPKQKIVIIANPRDQVNDFYLKVNKYGDGAQLTYV